MLELTLIQNRVDQPRYSSLVRYETRSDPTDDNLGTLIPVKTLKEKVNGQIMATRVTEVPYSQLRRESAPESAYAESKARTARVYTDPHSSPREEALAHDVIRTAGHGKPCLLLDEAAWIKAERILAGLDVPDDEPLEMEESDGE